ncbi:hypothetical protein [Aeromicrobium sp.]|uniref:hypothetical protein n=1 Tax=Aeromicrobium sp. TaxID=1871063 RepID=UPI0028AE05A3|nr:hypothetical protein [Aeromicrobium sp.]
MGAQSPRQSVVLALVTAAVSTVPIWRAPRPVRTVLLAGTGALAGGGAFTALSRPHVFGLQQEPAPAPVAASVGAAAGIASAGAMALALVLDREAERFLVRHGVRRPRLVLAAAGGVLSYAMDVLDRRFDTPD